MLPTTDSLMMFVEGAVRFLRDEVKIEVTEEQAKYLIMHHFDAFSVAYTRFRTSPDDSSRSMILNIVTTAAALSDSKKVLGVIA